MNRSQTQSNKTPNVCLPSKSGTLHSFLGFLLGLGHFVHSQFRPLAFNKLHIPEELKKKIVVQVLFGYKPALFCLDHWSYDDTR